jgi:hypothetical protein
MRKVIEALFDLDLPTQFPSILDLFHKFYRRKLTISRKLTEKKELTLT